MKPSIKKIGTIQEEVELCRTAFTTYPSTWAWCCHHEIHCEPLTEPFENRIQYILLEKWENEQAIRFRNFRPCKDVAATTTARDAYAAAVKTASDAYDAAVKPARDAYDAAVKPARDAYDAAVKPDSELLRVLHNKEWPDNTWNGNTIFRKESK